MTEATFVRITNKDIYNKLETINKRVGKIRGILRWHSWAIGILVIIISAIISRI